jgi:peptidoglycan/LPS O-acetylase OafA/YrhL
MLPRTLPQSLRGVALFTALALLIPATAMQVSQDVDWGPGDFLAAGVLLFGAGAAIVVGRRLFTRAGPRLAVTAAIALCACLVWAELAVGLFH